MKRLHPLTILVEFVEWLLKVGWVILLFVVVGAGNPDRTEGIMEIVGATVAGLQVFASAISVCLSYYRVGDGVFEMRTGWLQKKEVTIPLNRIQTVDLVRNPIHRVLGLAVVKIDGGAAGTEARLATIGIHEAEELVELLRHGESLSPPIIEPSALPPALWSARPRDLLLAGATGNRALVLVASVVGFVTYFGQNLRIQSIDQMTRRAESLEYSPTVVIALVAGVLLLGWIASMILALVQYHGFNLRQDGRKLVSRYGLLTQTVSAIPLGRVQMVYLRSGWIRRMLGLWELKCQTAAQVAQVPDKENPHGGLLVPLAPVEECHRVLRVAVPGASLEGVNWRAPSRKAFWSGWSLIVPWLVAISLLAAVLFPNRLGVPSVLLPLVAILIGTLAAMLRARSLAWARLPGHLVSRVGLLGHQIELVPDTKIQGVTWTQNGAQRRLGLASIHAQVAPTGSVHVRDLDLDVAQELFDELSHAAAETGDWRLDGV